MSCGRDESNSLKDKKYRKISLRGRREEIMLSAGLCLRVGETFFLISVVRMGKLRKNYF